MGVENWKLDVDELASRPGLTTVRSLLLAMLTSAHVVSVPAHRWGCHLHQLTRSQRSLVCSSHAGQKWGGLFAISLADKHVAGSSLVVSVAPLPDSSPHSTGNFPAM